MPLFSIHTNTTVGNKNALLTSASQMIASQLGKPESFVMVELDDGRAMLFAGSDAPLVHAQLKSLGLSSNQTETLSAAICSWIHETMGIPAERIYIEFVSPERAMWGWNGSTFG